MTEDLSFYLPACTPDLGGAASMLAELGGMVIFHDAAGCMENYAVYDEPRWFGSSALIYSSSLLQLDAVLGNDEPLIAGAVDAALQLKPAFVALIGTPVPAVTGMDLAGMAAEIEFRSHIPAFCVPCSGFQPYFRGAGQALAELIRRFAAPQPPLPGSVNVLGATPLDVSPEQLAALRARLEQAGWRMNGAFCMQSGLSDVVTMARAERNLVISEAGLPAAKLLQRRFGTPYTRLFPLTQQQAESLAPLPAAQDADPRVLVVGEPVFAESLAAALTQLRGEPAQALPVWTPEAVLAGQLEAPWELIVADPLLRPLCPPERKFFPWPHRALSAHLFPPAPPAQLEGLLSDLPT